MRRFFTVIAVSAAALATPVAAEQISRTIPVSQADLTDPTAAAALYQRITDTAEALCAKANPPLYGYAGATRAARAACVKEAVDRAVGTAHSPQLAAVHAEIYAAKPAPATLASR